MFLNAGSDVNFTSMDINPFSDLVLWILTSVAVLFFEY